jgi:hypothetical protein
VLEHAHRKTLDHVDEGHDRELAPRVQPFPRG